MKATLIFFLFSSLIIAQYCEDDYKLIETAYQRDFNKNIFESYLFSNEPGKIKSALLSISHSEDTSFVTLVTSLSFYEYAEMICFAIGQVGPCLQSATFLWSKIHSHEIFENSNFLFEALGKTGSEEDLIKIVEMYANSDALKFPYEGISSAIMQFSFRGITSEQAKQVLIDEVNNPFNSIRSKSDALFALARFGSSAQINNELIKILRLPITVDLDTNKLKQFALMNFRTQNFFPNNEDIYNNVLTEKNILLQIEAARTLCYKKMNNEKELNSFVNFINSDIPNRSRVAASSLKFLKIENEKLFAHLKKQIESKIISPPAGKYQRRTLFKL